MYVCQLGLECFILGLPYAYAYVQVTHTNLNFKLKITPL